MKIKLFIITAIITVSAIGITSCTGNNDNKQSSTQAEKQENVIDNKDEVTFLRTFLDNYIKLTGKQAQELAKKHLTQDFYSAYIENCNNQDNAIDLICELTLNEKVQKIDTIMKGIEDPTSFIVQVQAVDAEGNTFDAQYDMTVVNENGIFKLNDSQVND